MAQRRFLRLDFKVAQPAFRVRQGPLEQLQQLRFGQRPQLKDLGAGDQRGVDEKEGVMRRGADQPHDAGLDIRQEHILLRLVEAMDFINEQDRGLVFVGEPVGGGGQHAAHIGDVGFNPAQPLELIAGLAGDNLRQRRLAGARRAVEDQRLDAIRLNGAAQQLPRPQDVRLADELAQVAGAHPGRQRLMPFGAGFRRARVRRGRPGRGGKQIIPRHAVTISARVRLAQTKKGPAPASARLKVVPN